ncbi:MAG: hypothetical protein H0W88_07475 [Parachlamydiaceae bacterium]|nr:hypothetical protein [Parachlamydiaceae bacterium]
MTSNSLTLPSIVNHTSHPSQNTSKNFQDILGGENAFYNQPNYLEATKRDLSQKQPLQTTYHYNTNTDYKIIRIVKQILSAVLFPFSLLHSLVGKLILPGSYLYNIEKITNLRQNIQLDSEWKYKRLTIEVNGCKIDAAIVGKETTLKNGRWLLASNGNAEIYEINLFQNANFKKFLNKINSNAIVFNYPSVVASTGSTNRKSMAKAYLAILSFLEDQKGIGAKEIIGYGHSIGGGVQGDALKDHDFKKDIKYVFVKSRTFSDLSSIVSCLMNRIVGILVKILGWNISCLEASKKLEVPEIILQTAKVQDAEELTDSSNIIDDGIITAKSSLAKVLLDNDKYHKKNKIFIGIKEMHNAPIKNPSFIAERIERLLKV